MMLAKQLLPLLLVTASGVTNAQEIAAPEEVPFPFEWVTPTQAGVLEFQPDVTLLEVLTTLEEVVLVGAPLPSGRTVDLHLRRLDFDPNTVGIFVDGRRSSFDPGDLTLWKGEVVGLPGSHVSLALSSHGTYGWINDGREFTHISSMPGADGSWAAARGRIYSSRALSLSGTRGGPPVCALDELQGGRSGPFVVSDDFGDPQPGASPILELKMAVETDYQLFQVWNDLQAEETYVMALLGAVSDRYLDQVDIKVTYPYLQFYTKVGDPWTSQDNGGDCVDLVTEFAGAWSGPFPGEAHMAHFLSGADLGCGGAFQDALCDTVFGFAVSGNIDGGVTFPVVQGANTHDFVEVAHETGHVVGSPHTHEFCPPLDECATNCNNQINCTNQGTNMSYCFLCNGGVNNITTYFHPKVVNLLRKEALSSCIPQHEPGNPVILFADDFESGDLTTGGWTANRAVARPEAAHLSNFGVRIRKKGRIQRTIDTTGYEKVVLRYWRKTKNYDANEYLQVLWSDGNAWYKPEQTQAIDWGVLTFDLPVGAEDNPNFAIRFKSRGNEGKERGDVDDIEVLATLKG